MKRSLPILLALFFTAAGLSQKKSELFAEIENLKTEKRDIEQQLSEAKREISSSSAKAETLEVENIALRDANATLLKNLSSFSELSKKSSENVNATLAALERKEKQLSGINQMIASNDSTAIALLGRVKQTMGSEAKADFVDGSIVISNSLNTLFGSDTGNDLTGEGRGWLEKVAAVIKANTALSAEVEGLNITGEFGVTYDQANVISKELATTYKVPVENIGVSVKDGNFKEGINIKLQPNYQGFYDKVKESVKTAQ